ncbi:MAG: HAD-IA family hydrolase [Ilumatobacteraceae bacterium]
MHRAVLFDFGGVIVSGPFESFNRFERERGLPTNFIRSVNASNPHDNAWAKLERSEISVSQFDELFAAESELSGHRVSGADVLELLAGEVRQDMVHALDVLKSSGYIVACLTNNVLTGQSAPPTIRQAALQDVLARFDAIIESSKIGARKPEVRFYEIACATIKVEPCECVFLDDLGINLKPAAAMGMTTIKVTSSSQAIEDLSQILGLVINSPS